MLEEVTEDGGPWERGRTAERVELEMVLKEVEGLSGQDQARPVGGWVGERTV